MAALQCACCADGASLATASHEFVIEVGGRRHTFEMHYYCGPAVLNKEGNPDDQQPGPRSPFWTAVTLWAQQGKHVGADGLCIWQPEPEPELVHLGGRNYAVKGSALDPSARGGKGV